MHPSSVPYLSLFVTLTVSTAILLPRQGGSGTISYNYYTPLKDTTSSYPMCGMPYSSLNLDHIVSLEGANKANCGVCLKVCGPTGKCDNFMVVDGKPSGLDINPSSVSGAIYDGAVGTSPEPPGYGTVQGTWTPVDVSSCTSYWTGVLKSGEPLLGSLGSYPGAGGSGTTGGGASVVAAAPATSNTAVVVAPVVQEGVVQQQQETVVQPSVVPVPPPGRHCWKGRCW